MWTCPKCKAAMQDDAGKCLACGASSEGVQHWQPPAGWEFDLESFAPQDDADEDESPTGPAADVGPEEGRWISQWGSNGARIGCVAGLLLGVIGSLLAVAVALTAPAPRDEGGGLAGVVLLAVAMPFVLGGISSIFWASVGIVLEALVKSIRGRPRGVDRAIARHQEDGDRSARSLLRGNKSRPTDTAVRPAGEDVPTDPAG